VLLERTGYYVIPQAAGNNPLPAHGLPPAQLERFWERLLADLEKRKGMRQGAIRDGSTGALEFAYHGKMEVKTVEAALALVHSVARPDVKETCGRGCPHLSEGLSPEAVKCLLDSLDAYRARTDYESDENYIAERVRAELVDCLTFEKTLFRRETDAGVYEVIRTRPSATEERFLARWPDGAGGVKEAQFTDVSDAAKLMERFFPELADTDERA
jgi:hypothetical protein